MDGSILDPGFLALSSTLSMASHRHCQTGEAWLWDSMVPTTVLSGQSRADLMNVSLITLNSDTRISNLLGFQKERDSIQTSENWEVCPEDILCMRSAAVSLMWEQRAVRLQFPNRVPSSAARMSSAYSSAHQTTMSQLFQWRLCVCMCVCVVYNLCTYIYLHKYIRTNINIYIFNVIMYT